MASSERPSEEEARARALGLHRQAPVFDAHADTVALDVVEGRRRLADSGRGGHIDLGRLRQGGVGIQIFTLFVPPSFPPAWNTLRALEILDALAREVYDNAADLVWVLRADDLEPARRAGRIGVVVSLEGCEVLAGSLAVLHAFYRLGVRAAGLTWNLRNEVADGVGEARGAGLTAFGRAVVKEMNALGMVVDVSHLSEAGFWEVLELSRDPVIASHSNARSLCRHPRNLPDEAIRALARKGGVVGINFYSSFLREDGQASLEDVVRHIDHVVSLVGPDHVGLGSDFDGISSPALGLEDTGRLPTLTEALVRQGYSDEVILKILGGNFLRVFREVLG